ncbi:MAG TPA: glycoside hydrolase family 16 protein [Paludibacter sp.]|nr:glycoside hydrolase family 16 protein [Paludibacter sp.]
MKILILSLGLFLFIGGSNAQDKAPATSGNVNYRLVWHDEFDNPRLDARTWTIIKDGKGGGNKELQYYRRQNIAIGSEPGTGESCLVITARKENYRSRPGTSGRITSSNKMYFRYGKIEARIKMPKTANGLWPAFWLVGEGYPTVVWPKCGEIDIVEMGNADGIRNNVQNRYFNGACHWGEEFNHGKYPNYGKPTTSEYSLQDGFHLYTLVWDKESVRMYLDQDKYPDANPYFEMPIQGEDLPNNPAHYFHKPYHVIFNVAVGGNFPHIYNIEEVTALKDGEATMYVDYVRLYQQGTPEESISKPGKGHCKTR